MKNLLIILLAFMAIGQGQAQVKVGLKVSPGLNFNRTFVKEDSMPVSVDGNGAKIKVPFGAFVDIPFSERYYFTTGVNLVGKLSDLHYNLLTIGPISPDEKIRLQYLQLPLTFKLFTDEVSIDKRLYFQFGPTLDILLSSKGQGEKWISKIIFGDISFIFAGGLDFNIGPNTSMCIGVSYYRGLINIVKEHNLPVKDFSVKTDLLLLEIGIRP
ncbi:MAG TPA: porin family protein [Cyclobacteriaceae bacterium]|nr:porin family protein [Cyclobacteriaceae bacterium]